MSISLTRSFSPLQESTTGDTDYEYWWHLASSGKGFSWSDLLKKRVVVVLGEAGIGKTFEFKNQADILAAEGKAAFFLPLNLLETIEGFNLALIEQMELWEAWKIGNDAGHFFLDAVDEARLTSHEALEKALVTVRKHLSPYLKRVSYSISSRITDWSVPEVQDLIRRHLVAPLSATGSVATHVPDSELVVMDATDSQPSINLEVFKLDRLSREDAERLSAHFGVTAMNVFWQQIEDGGYEFLATRPLDLEWLAALWQQNQALGSYSELIESAITFRLRETNPGYVASNAVLSRAQLRNGVERLAAACVFSGNAYVQVGTGASISVTVAPADMLPDWTALEHLRLLGTAVFDEATYGRVKFHHRAVREYLAACWVESELAAGLPLQLALSLFVKMSYGRQVLLTSRRPVLCWLAVLNAKVRQYVIRHFPEMLMLGGDPQHWSVSDVAEAFEGYIEQLATGYTPNWYNDASEVRRVAHRLPSEALSDYLKRYSKNPKVMSTILLLIKHGRVAVCAEHVFSLYRQTGATERELLLALDALSSVATKQHRSSIALDLINGNLATNELIAAGLEVVGLEQLDADQLAKIFLNTKPEGEFGGGPMAMAFKIRLLPDLNVETTLKLLSSLLASLPSTDVEKITGGHGTDNRIGWILTILPDALLHALRLITGSATAAFNVLTSASLVMESIRHTTYVNDEDFRQLRAEIEKHEDFRLHLGLTIGLSGNNSNAILSLSGWPGLVRFWIPDLPWLVQEATRQDLKTQQCHVWYQVARDIAFSGFRGTQRRAVFAALTCGPEAALRRSDIATLTTQQITAVRHNIVWKREERARKAERRKQLDSSKVELLNELEQIRSGASFNSIRWLVAHAAERDSTSKYTKVNVGPVFRDFGPEIGEAFKSGLAKLWRTVSIPQPANYLDNRLPWAGLIGLASVNYAFASGLDIAVFTPDEVARIAQLSVWEHNGTEPWFAMLAVTRINEVFTALMPWCETELGLTETTPNPRTIDLVLKGPAELQMTFLEHARVLLSEGRIPLEHMQRRLCREMVVAGCASKEFIGVLASKHLAAGLTVNPPQLASDWLGQWVSIDLPVAWQWMVANCAVLANSPAEAAAKFAGALESLSWARALSGSVEETATLVSLFHYLNPFVDAVEDDALRHSAIQSLRDRIPGILASLQGTDAQHALQTLAGEHAGTRIGDWILGQALEHAAAAAERNDVVSPTQLQALGEVYTQQPRTEGELFEQVLARLGEIREGVEGGPFSDRVLFSAKTTEKQLQIWLAARLNDTARRRFIPRFAVTREPQVDADKRTDIEVSCAAGKVCIEIKPLDAGRGYSANSLTSTLKDQLVGQYLTGQNSKHGILVLVSLDDKKWQIPNGPKKGGYADLLDYLRVQAKQIEAVDKDVERLEVFSFNCV